MPNTDLPDGGTLPDSGLNKSGEGVSTKPELSTFIPADSYLAEKNPEAYIYLQSVSFLKLLQDERELSTCLEYAYDDGYRDIKLKLNLVQEFISFHRAVAQFEGKELPVLPVAETKKVKINFNQHLLKLL